MYSEAIIDIKDVLTQKFNEEIFIEFVINLVNLESKDLLNFNCFEPNGTSYEKYVDYVKDIGKYKDNNRNTIVLSIVKLKESPEKARTMQRNFIANHMKEIGANVSIVGLYSEKTDVWRISFVKLDYTLDIHGIHEKLTPAKRYSYLIDPSLNNHTAQEQLSKLYDYDSQKATVEDIENVFSVEVVTDEFFKMYKEKYLDLKELLEKDSNFISEANRLDIKINDFSEEFAKKLMGQISFLYFLQKKGWLGVQIVPKEIKYEEIIKILEKQNEDTKRIICKVYTRQNDIVKRLPRELKKLTDKESEKLALAFKNTDYDKIWGTGSKTFIRDVFETANEHKLNFFNEYLEPLFYNALSKERGETEYYPRFNCKIPFLNGGLFDPIYGYKWNEVRINIPNNFFSNKKDGNDTGSGLLDLFDMYNFTINEDEPLEKEIAVDPEMLGKIFENLLEVKERKSKGAFYTPREIVHYMCQESLINYLENETGIFHDYIEIFIKYGEIIKDVDININKKEDYKMPKVIVDNLNNIDKALENIAIADPSVGSGAFPLGMLNEIVKARNVITQYISKQNINKSLVNDRSIYNLKRHAMKECIFAVDIEPSAVDITKLRLWLSLVVDADQKTVNTLPNLDYNIMVGNSLIDEFKGIKLFDEELLKDNIYRKYKEVGNQITIDVKGSNFTIGIDQEYKLLEDIQLLQSKYFDTKDAEIKIDIKKKIEIKEWDLIEYKLNREQGLSFKEIQELKKQRSLHKRPYFLWKLEFSKIFKEKDGFDIVIGNPPYIEFKKLDKYQKKEFKNRYVSAKGKYDIYVIFIEMSKNILNKNGCLCFINPTMFMKRDYGKEIRKFIAKNFKVSKILDFEDKQMFSSATTYTGIFILKNNIEKSNKYDFEYYRLNEIVYESFKLDNDFNLKKYFEFMKCSSEKLNDEIWNFNNNQNELLLKKIEDGSTTLEELSEVIFQGIASGKDEVFYINQEIVNQYNIEDEIIHPILKGKDIKMYNINWSGNYVIYPYKCRLLIKENEMKQKYSNTYKYLVDSKEKLKGRGYFDKSNKLWYELWNQRNGDYFEKTKIITSEINKNNSFVIDKNKFYGNTKTYNIILKDNTEENYYYILGILNSDLINYYYKNITVPKSGGFYAYKTQFLKKIPIKFNKLYFEKISNIAKSLTVEINESLINQINDMVYKLYKINDNEIEIINNFLFKK